MLHAHLKLGFQLIGVGQQLIHEIPCKALEKKNLMMESFQSFCKEGPGRSELKKSLLEIWFGFAADGEAAEPLAA